MRGPFSKRWIVMIDLLLGAGIAGAMARRRMCTAARLITGQETGTVQGRRGAVAKIMGLLVALLIGCAAAANAQSSYPGRPVRIVVGFGCRGVAGIALGLVGER